VEEQLDAYLVLGCNGHSIKGNFTNCLGVENPIVKLSEVDDQNYERVISFFEKACGFFDGPINDQNKCSNIIGMLYRNYSIIDDEMLHNVQLFMKTHKSCGFYLFLIMKEDFDDKQLHE
jgi:hypothetical protein